MNEMLFASRCGMGSIFNFAGNGKFPLLIFLLMKKAEIPPERIAQTRARKAFVNSQRVIECKQRLCNANKHKESVKNLF